MTNKVSNINHDNKSLEFIDSRILDDKYRGSWSSQHNRYTMDTIVTILTLFNKYAPNNGLMVIRTADISKRPNNTAEEQTYAQFCNEAKAQARIGTQDAMRKNLFVDLHRMGLIERFDKNKVPTNPLSKRTVKYVSLTAQGIKLIEAKTDLDKFFVFSKGVDQLLGGYIDVLLNLLRDTKYNLEKISIYEFMFFVSAIGTKTTFNISTDKCVELIKEYRNLSSIQEKSVIEQLKERLKPKNYTGTKTAKRDFHNWHNKAKQVFSILDQTVYFEVRGETLFLKKGQNSYAGEEKLTRLDRSLSEKYKYFVKHKIKKVEGFELHHVVPLAWSESIHQFKLLDKWKNMVYIDAFSHAKITQNRNRNVVMSASGDDLRLKDYSEKKVYLKVKKNIIYDTKKQTEMLKYNDKMLKIVQ
jgi:hypothetical protein